MLWSSAATLPDYRGLDKTDAITALLGLLEGLLISALNGLRFGTLDGLRLGIEYGLEVLGDPDCRFRTRNRRWSLASK
jgi:hypothetical protein